MDKRWGNGPTPDPLGEQGLVPAIGVTQPTSFKWDRQGVAYHAVAMPLTRTHWTYVTALPMATFEAATQDLLRTSALAVALGLVLAFVAIMLLELLVAFLQAYVFAILTCIYLNEALHLHDHH